jgi:hypothetical protein
MVKNPLRTKLEGGGAVRLARRRRYADPRRRN